MIHNRKPKNAVKTLLFQLQPQLARFPFLLNESSNTGEKITISDHPSNTVGDISNMVKARMGFDSVYHFRAMRKDNEIVEQWHEVDSILEVGLRDSDEINIRPLQVGGKSVIYLLPPSGKEIYALVKLSLLPEWRLSAIYPVVPINTLNAGDQALQWNVKASSDGTLLEKSTGLEVAY